MESFLLENDIKVFCVNASSFPGGVMEAHQKLHSLVPFSPGRKYFGISYPDGKGNITYKTATEETEPGEGERLNCESFVIKKGTYTCITISEYMKNLSAIGTAFKELTSLPNIDRQGCCVEWYLNQDDVRCMVRLS